MLSRGGAGLAVAAVLLFGIGTAEAFKPSTHLYAANVVLQELQSGHLTILGKAYNADSRVKKAILDWPKHFRGGVLGPDAFPDILFGQSKIHPDTRCDNGTASSCAMGGGASYAYDWLDYVFEKGWEYYESHKNENKGPQALAFTYGFLIHAAGDMWAHTLVNHHSGGVFPSITGNLSIAICHLIIEGYIGTKTPSASPGSRDIDAPMDFVRQTFIFSSKARSLAKDSIIDKFLDLKEDVKDFKKSIEDAIAERAFAAFITGGFSELAARASIAYAEAWIIDIDNGLNAWPIMARDMAQKMFVEDRFSDGIDVLKKFAQDHLLSMAGVPDLLVSVLTFTVNVPQIIDVDAWVSYFVEMTTGLSVAEWKAYLTNPALYIDGPQRYSGIAAGTKTTLDTLMGGGSGPVFSDTDFAALHNTLQLSKLILLSSSQFDRFLSDCGVPTATENADNPALSTIKSLDGNHQWRQRAPSSAPSGALSFGQGMFLWKDCLARKRVFRRIFKDWENPTDPFPNGPESCSKISEGPPARIRSIDLVHPTTFQILPKAALPPDDSDDDASRIFSRGRVTDPFASEKKKKVHVLCQGMKVVIRVTLEGNLENQQSFVAYLRVLEARGSRRLVVFHRRLDANLVPIDPAAHPVQKPTILDFEWTAHCPGEHHIRVDLFNTLRGLPEPRSRSSQLADLGTPFKTSEFPIAASAGALEVEVFPTPAYPTPGECCTAPAPGSAGFTSIRVPRPGGGFDTRPLNPPIPAGAANAGLCAAVGTFFNTPSAPTAPVDAFLDVDGDTVPDGVDNCLFVANQDQADTNGDGIGDACAPINVAQMRLLTQNFAPFNVARGDAIARRLLELGLIDPKPVTLDSGATGMATTVLARLAKINTPEGRSLYLGTARALVGGFAERGQGVDILDETLDVRSKTLTLKLGAIKPEMGKATAPLRLRIPRVLFGSEKLGQAHPFIVSKDGNRTWYEEKTLVDDPWEAFARLGARSKDARLAGSALRDAPIRILVVHLRPGTKKVDIEGNEVFGK